MPRRKFNLNPQSPYHISSRCINKEWFAIPLTDVWTIAVRYLYLVHHAFGLKIYSFVLMTNHFHMIAAAPNNNLSEAMQFFLANWSKDLLEQSSRINQIWSQRFSRCEITSEHYFYNAYKYIYRNPVEAGLCDSVLDYPFSSLYGLVGRDKIDIPIEYDFVLYRGDIEQNLQWLDLCPKESDLSAMRATLKKTSFKLPKKRNKSHPLEKHRL